jgi:tRNA pseudouridine32 synthase/23S rRNA pseudouridine746 synthase
MIEIPILFEDGEALVIDKPAGLPLDRPRAGGIALEDRLDELKLGFQRPPAPVHRLDRDTSGCLLLARNPKALKRFSAAFEARQVEKVYWGVVAGEVEGTAGDRAQPVEDFQRGGRLAHDRREKGKPAVTHWRVLARLPGRTLVEFRLETGRTHQVRVHALTGLGAPLLGDPIYGDGKGAARTLLHAARIVVPREGKEAIVAEAPIPADIAGLGFTL